MNMITDKLEETPKGQLVMCMMMMMMMMMVKVEMIIEDHAIIIILDKQIDQKTHFIIINGYGLELNSKSKKAVHKITTTTVRVSLFLLLQQQKSLYIFCFHENSMSTYMHVFRQ